MPAAILIAPAEAENGAPSDQAIAKLVDQIRAAEKQFANLETVVTKKRQWPDRTAPVKARRGKAIDAAHFHETVAVRTVIQGDFYLLKNVDFALKHQLPKRDGGTHGGL